MIDIRYLEHDQIDLQRWDQALKSSHNYMIYAESWYLSLICPRWSALVMGDYQAVMPLIHREKMGFAYLFQSFHAQQLGVFSIDVLEETEILRFLESIPSRYKLIDIRLNRHNRVSSSDFEVVAHKNFELSLREGYETLRQQYSKNTARMVRKALKQGLSVQRGTYSSDEIIRLFRENKGQSLNMLDNEYYETLAAIVSEADRRGKAETWSVHDSEQQLLGGGLFLTSDDRIIYLLNVSTESGKKLGAGHFLVDRLISQYAGTNRIFDFEGSDDENLGRFNQSFGSKESLYLQVIKNRLPRYIRWIKS